MARMAPSLNSLGTADPAVIDTFFNPARPVVVAAA